MKYRYLTFLLLTAIFSSCSKEEIFIESSDAVEVHLTKEIKFNAIETSYIDVSYGDHPEQVFDIYLPQGRTTQNTKVLMVIHGGNWINGDKNGLTDFVLDLKENNPNHAIVNINYVLGSESHYAFPNQFFDIKKVIDFIKEKKQEYLINPEFGLIGSSAGGHLALQYTYKYDTVNDVKFVSSLGGPTNFLDPYYEETSAEQMHFLMDNDHYENSNKTFDRNGGQHIDFLKILSPAYEVITNSSPTILFYGNEDTIVPISNGIIIDKHLSKQGVTSSLNIYQGGHGAWKTEDYKETLHSNLHTFIDAHLYVSDK